VACSLDCLNKLPLVFGACSRNALGDNLSLLAHKALKSLLVFVVDVYLLCVAETARAFLAQ
jgi:hypothetical protein